jgi:hypothetical protein
MAQVHELDDESRASEPSQREDASSETVGAGGPVHGQPFTTGRPPRRVSSSTWLLRILILILPATIAVLVVGIGLLGLLVRLFAI